MGKAETCLGKNTKQIQCMCGILHSEASIFVYRLSTVKRSTFLCKPLVFSTIYFRIAAKYSQYN